MRRILLKLSGEALAGDKKHGFDEETVRKVAAQIAEVVKGGVQVGVVIGGGNFWRGKNQREHGPDQGGSDRDAGHGHELYLCIRNVQS